MRYALAAAVILVAMPASAEPFAARLRRLCDRLDQETCWLKPGARYCPSDGDRCFYLPEDEPAQVLEIVGARVTVRIARGVGTVPMSSLLTADH